MTGLRRGLGRLRGVDLHIFLVQTAEIYSKPFENFVNLFNDNALNSLLCSILHPLQNKRQLLGLHSGTEN